MQLMEPFKPRTQISPSKHNTYLWSYSPSFNQSSALHRLNYVPMLCSDYPNSCSYALKD